MNEHMKNIEDPAARQLVIFMHELSQERWFAGWLTSTSEDLWDFHEMGTGATEQHPEWCLSETEVSTLRILASQCGSWPYWGDGAQVEMVPIPTWRNARRMDAFIRSDWEVDG